jgi:hypothetical protein
LQYLLAESTSANLGNCFYGRKENFDHRGTDWVLLFFAPFCPTGWDWLAIVNDYDTDEWVLVAINRNWPSPSAAERKRKRKS